MTLSVLGALSILALPPFAPDKWQEVETAFSGAANCELQQAWRDAPEARFLPARARIGWRQDSLWIYAELQDLDIFNSATKPNQATWTTGDVFEIFLRPLDQESYFELHITPENQTLQLSFPGENALNSGRDWRDFLVSKPLFSSRTLVERGKWRVLAEIPIANLAENPSAREWAFSFSRYDATRGQKTPVLSSSSPHQVPRFHRQEEWNRFVFEAKEPKCKNQ